MRLGTIRDGEEHGPNANRSVKVDYAVFTEGEVILVELKTENESYDPEQIKDYYLAIGKELDAVVSGIDELKTNSKQQDKYEALQLMLKSPGNLSADVHAASVKRKFYKQVVVIKPSEETTDPDGKTIFIYFRDVIDALKDDSSDVAVRFSDSLRNWTPPQAQ